MSRFGQVAAGRLNNKAFRAGAWTDFTPPGLGLLPLDHTKSYGVTWIEVSPLDNNVVYCCVDQLGLWKTTNGGLNWALVGGTISPPNFGTTTTYFDSPICVRVDPSNANHIYVTQGVRGSTLGFWVSTDGVNFAQPAGFQSVSATLGTADCTQLAIDPANFNNLLLSSHQQWPGFSNNGFLSSTDGGSTWTMNNPQSAWTVGSLGVTILHDPPSGQGNSTTWLVGSDSAGLWRTPDSGTTWTQVSTNGPVHGGHVCFYDSSGRLWAGAGSYPMYSNDNGLTWTQPTTGLVNAPSYYNVCSDGTTLFTQPSYTGDNGIGASKPFVTSLVSDGNNWSNYNAQLFTDGPFLMRFAPTTKRLYAACWGAGLQVLQF